MPWDDEADGLAAERMTDSLEAQLLSLRRRGVPVRGITAGPVEHIARLRLADSTTLLVANAMGPQISRVVRAIHFRSSVTIDHWDRSPEGLLVYLAGVPGREPACLWVLGPDQPD